MSAGEVEGVGVMFQKERFVVGQVVVLSEESPYSFVVVGSVVVPLVELEVGEFFDQSLVDDEALVSVGTR